MCRVRPFCVGADPRGVSMLREAVPCVRWFHCVVCSSPKRCVRLHWAGSRCAAMSVRCRRGWRVRVRC